MKRIILTIALVVCIIFNSYAQKNISEDLKTKFQPAIDSLEMRINYLISQDDSLSKMKDLRQLHILLPYIDDSLSKDNFLDNSFTDNIYIGYYNLPIKQKSLLKRKAIVPYLQAYTIICDSNYNEVAGGSAVSISILYKAHFHSIAKLVALYEPEFVIALGGFYAYICIKGNDVFVFRDTNEETQMYSLKEFVECCYEELCPACVRQERYLEDEKNDR